MPLQLATMTRSMSIDAKAKRNTNAPILPSRPCTYGTVLHASRKASAKSQPKSSSGACASTIAAVAQRQGHTILYFGNRSTSHSASNSPGSVSLQSSVFSDGLSQADLDRMCVTAAEDSDEENNESCDGDTQDGTATADSSRPETWCSVSVSEELEGWEGKGVAAMARSQRFLCMCV
mmetsp:Transcript_58801/g.108585  ORF Transcript_58801/g.108585 Transcript_58801/m.108585 type:complete len:177 (-) Transcript_58801:68-598(-)